MGKSTLFRIDTIDDPDSELVIRHIGYFHDRCILDTSDATCDSCRLSTQDNTIYRAVETGACAGPGHAISWSPHDAGAGNAKRARTPPIFYDILNEYRRYIGNDVWVDPLAFNIPVLNEFGHFSTPLTFAFDRSFSAKKRIHLTGLRSY